MKASLLLLLISSQVFAITQFFGFEGSNGISGLSGTNGLSAQSISIKATGQSLSYDLRGKDGRAGSDGRFGQDAYSCFQRRGSYNERGARGGSGGIGGAGGNGGNGGDAVIFYNSKSDLKNILINSEAGIGSIGGRGARGGEGCYCQVPSWTQTRCTTRSVCRNVRRCRTVNGRRVCTNRRVCTPRRVCNRIRFSCFNGNRGRDGRDGSRGLNGSRGSLTLIPGQKAIPFENKKITGSIEGLSSQVITLNQNIWKNKTGASSLLAAGSKVQDRYRILAENKKIKVETFWNASRDISDFSEAQVTYRYDDSKLGVSFSEDYFVDYEVSVVGDTYTVQINEIYTKKELTSLDVSHSGTRSSFKITVDDFNALSLVAKNNVSLKLQYKSTVGNWRTLYNKSVSASKYVVRENQIVISAGKLGFKTKKIRAGQEVRFTVTVKRSFGNKSEVVRLVQGKTEL